MRSRTPAIARLHRARWVTTLLFAATTAICLLVLATIAVRTDSQSRTHDLDNDVIHRADGLSRVVSYDADGALSFDALPDDDLARGADALGVVQPDAAGPPRISHAYTSPATLPGPADLAWIWQRIQEEQQTVLFTADGTGGRGFHWAAAPVGDANGTVVAAVLVGDDPTPSHTAHDRLLRWLALGCLGLVLAAAAVGHLLSGRAMRPALRGLERQEQFLAEAAHELRTPLATLRLVVESGSGSPGRAPAALDEAVRLVDRLGRLVTGLLARARVEAGTHEIELTPLRLDQLVEQTVEELPDTAGVTVGTEATVVNGDPELLAQAVRNLVENALRHGGGTPVEVSVTAGRVAVRDHGPGVPAKDRTRVFERRVTGAASTGTGTGLAIVRWVAELHGGTAQLSPAPGGGLQAELLLPERTAAD
ncbi:sensor histidine kinase [Kitasatospora sp. NBC_01266]|uniref:sensor histidine kinase n=1 Tax=Kitasatospora sp. NBC_01266 TaxID=2903572 RepID=UPI002E3791B9|nr:HAMP domain-containing sensor histidine kinase [Kitasatospora sp. NBC_01266]